MTAISSDTIIENVWRNFYDLVKNNVKTVTANSQTWTIQTYTNSFSSKIIDTKSNYPIIIVNDPEFDEEFFTLKKNKANFSITIDIYVTCKEAASKFLSLIRKIILSNKGTLADVGIQNLIVSDTDTDMIERGGFEVHIKSITFDFIFTYTKTTGY